MARRQRIYCGTMFHSYSLHDHSLHVPNIGSTAQTNYHSIIQNIFYVRFRVFYRPQSKVMFSEACWCRVCLMEGSATWGESAYKVSGSREGLPTEWGSVSWGERPLQRSVHILLECILIQTYHCFR